MWGRGSSYVNRARAWLRAVLSPVGRETSAAVRITKTCTHREAHVLWCLLLNNMLTCTHPRHLRVLAQHGHSTGLLSASWTLACYWRVPVMYDVLSRLQHSQPSLELITRPDSSPLRLLTHNCSATVCCHRKSAAVLRCRSLMPLQLLRLQQQLGCGPALLKEFPEWAHEA
jgi:hypothetical protein